jgi:hypothetical protein
MVAVFEKYVHVYVNRKMRPVEIIAAMGKGYIEENGGGSECDYDIL